MGFLSFNSQAYFPIFSVKRITIKHPDFYVWNKVCAKVMHDCPGEFADGGIVQKDFQSLMEMHVGAWSANVESYRIKQPVRNIGLQVTIFDCNWMTYPVYLSAAYIAPKVF